MKTEAFKHSRLARTPPSTFLFLHLHLSNSPGSENPILLLLEDRLLSLEASASIHPTTNDNRYLSAVQSLIVMRSFAGHEWLRWPWANAVPRSVAGL